MASKKKLLERLVVAMETQAAILVRADERLEAQIKEQKERMERQMELLRTLANGADVIPGEEPGEFMVIDPDSDIIKH
jgi:hypothetical protein